MVSQLRFNKHSRFTATNDGINEVYPRVYMSGYGPAGNKAILKDNKITHILTVTPYAKPLFEKDGIEYLIFDEISDNGQ